LDTLFKGGSVASSKHSQSNRRAGFISTRLAGTDGVSLETEKWAAIFQQEGFECFFFAGELDWPPERSYLVETADFRHPAIRNLHRKCFGPMKRHRSVTDEIHTFSGMLKEHLYRFIEKYDIRLLVVENALTIPVHLSFGIALTELIAETGITTIAHHHDFFWERQRFKTNAVWDYLNMAFPPNLPAIRHVVINSSAAHHLALRTGISSKVIPNVMDFENPPSPPDAYSADVRKTLGIDEDALLILQPTRIVKRKRIELAIELVHRLDRKAVLVISHASGDEGYDYENRIREYSKMLSVNTLFVSNQIQENRGVTSDGKKIYALEDIYPHADLVTYPSTHEGFGNAFLEAVYFRRPIVVNTYSIYLMDIKPKGFQTIELDGYVSENAVRQVRKILEDPGARKQMTDHNHAVARRYYSYAVLEGMLCGFIRECLDATQHQTESPPAL